MKFPFFLLLIFNLLIYKSFSQSDSTQILPPTGKWSVGAAVYEWTDVIRQNRKIAVQCWYPSDSRSAPQAYTQSKDYQHVKANSMSHVAIAKKAKNCPLVLICPGRGVEKYGYTTLAEELASHGYVVVSIDMPEIGYVIYENGEIIKPNPAFRPSRELMMGDYAKVDAFFEPASNLGKADLEFVMNQVQIIDNQVFKQINFKNIGIFGHSLGGRIAGAFSASNPNVKAFISMEGIPPREVRYNGMKVPMALLYSSGQPEAALVNYRSVIEGRKSDVYLFELEGFGHNSLTDFAMVTPAQFKYKISPQKGLEIGRKIVLGYFEKYLRNEAIELKFAQTKTESFLKKVGNAP